MTGFERLLLLVSAGTLALSAALCLVPEPALRSQPVYVPASAPSAEPTPGALWLDITFSVDINHADADALEALPGIGETLARRIVDYRSLHGPFRTPEDLLRVDGIHESTLNTILAAAELRE